MRKFTFAKEDLLPDNDDGISNQTIDTPSEITELEKDIETATEVFLDIVDRKQLGLEALEELSTILDNNNEEITPFGSQLIQSSLNNVSRIIDTDVDKVLPEASEMTSLESFNNGKITCAIEEAKEGIFKKLIRFIKEMWKRLINFMKNLFSSEKKRIDSASVHIKRIKDGLVELSVKDRNLSKTISESIEKSLSRLNDIYVSDVDLSKVTLQELRQIMDHGYPIMEVGECFDGLRALREESDKFKALISKKQFTKADRESATKLIEGFVDQFSLSNFNFKKVKSKNIDKHTISITYVNQVNKFKLYYDQVILDDGAFRIFSYCAKGGDEVESAPIKREVIEKYIKSVDGSELLNMANVAFRTIEDTKQKIYKLVDEYDNLANTMMLYMDHAEEALDMQLEAETERSENSGELTHKEFLSKFIKAQNKNIVVIGNFFVAYARKNFQVSDKIIRSILDVYES